MKIIANMEEILKIINNRFDSLDNDISKVKIDLKDHMKRTDANEKQMAFIQWVLPVCATVIAIALAIILG